MQPSKAEVDALRALKKNVLDSGKDRRDLLRKGDFIPEIFFLG